VEKVKIEIIDNENKNHSNTASQPFYPLLRKMSNFQKSRLSAVSAMGADLILQGFKHK